MLLAIDIGNTNIVSGLFQNNNLISKWRISTDIKKTEDEYFIIIESLLKDYKKEVNSVIFSSVVPSLDPIFSNLFRKNFNIEPVIVNHKLRLDINLKYRNPEEIGADRIVNATAASKIYGPPLIIIDCGTATTFCFVDKEYNYLGGLIMPGIKIMRDALHKYTAKLPIVNIIKPDFIIADNTISAIQAGLYYHNIGAFNYLINLLLTNYDKNSKIILTGGLAELFINDINYKTVYDPDLTLKGLNIIYNLNS